jgi:transaldolase
MSWGCIEQLFIVMVAKILCAQKKRNNNHALSRDLLKKSVMTEKMSKQLQIADELGVHRNTVAADLCTKNSVMTEKVVHKQPRTRICYQINQGLEL